MCSDVTSHRNGHEQYNTQYIFLLIEYQAQSQLLQVWAHGSMSENGGLLCSGWEWVAAPSGKL